MKEKRGHSLLYSLDHAVDALYASTGLHTLQSTFCQVYHDLTEDKPFALSFITRDSGTIDIFFSVGIKAKKLPEISKQLNALCNDSSSIVSALFSGKSDAGTLEKSITDGEISFTFIPCTSEVLAVYMLSETKPGKVKKSEAALLSLLCRAAGQQYAHLRNLPPAPQPANASKEDAQDAKRFSFVLNTVADGILVFNSDNLILMANREAEKIWGYEPGTLAGSYIHKLLEETENAPAALINFLLNPTADSEIIGKIIEFIGFRKDKSRFPLEAKIQESVIGDELFFTAAVADITERKQTMEALVKAKEKAEESTRAKEEFLAHISHEIRTPINAVIGLTSLLLQLHPEGEALEYLKGIKISSDNLLLLVNDVLDLSKIQAGKVELVEYEFEMADVFKRIYQILAVKAAEKNIALSFDIDPTIPPLLYGDAARLSQVLLNIASNAVKFTNHGSVFYSVSVKQAEEKICELEFRVKDTGIGIPENKLNDIFESFTQITYAQRTHATGTGLGLTISKLLVERFGGKLTVKSKVGAGSQFSFTIPLQRIPESAQPAKVFGNEENITADLDKARILIVEDNKLNVLVIRKMLESWNAKYEVASNGAEALELLNHEEFDLILMDISMPVLNGYETTNYIRQNFNPPKRDIPILALTATILVDDKKNMTDAGMNDYIAKPFQAAELASKIVSYTKKGVVKKQTENEEDGPSPLKSKSYDLSYLKKAFKDDDDSLMEFMNKFLEQIPESIAMIDAAMDDGDIAMVCKAAHKIKSPFTYLGITESVDILNKVESALEKGLTKQDIETLLQKLRNNWGTTKNELENEISLHKQAKTN